MKQKPIIIWWSVDTSEPGFEEGIRAEEPISILPTFLVKYAGKNASEDAKSISRCPAFSEELQNLYGIKPYYDYKLNIDSNHDISSNDYDQNFFDNHVYIRSERFVSFRTNHIFFAPYEESLEMSVIAASLEDNDIANRTILIPGKLDIGKYFRTSDFAFIFKKETSSIQISRNQICMYIKFHTKRPIVFKQFFWDEKINEYYRPIMAVKRHKYTENKKSTLLSYYYKLFDRFQFKKKIIKIIEQNLTK